MRVRVFLCVFCFVCGFAGRMTAEGRAGQIQKPVNTAATAQIQALDPIKRELAQLKREIRELKQRLAVYESVLKVNGGNVKLTAAATLSLQGSLVTVNGSQCLNRKTRLMTVVKPGVTIGHGHLGSPVTSIHVLFPVIIQ